ncbi:MAG: NAD(P)-dependent oxidoreductase, partial [Caulobacterales bacterium]|nr:NAD(P)-dependent oxidoreductase [Caulobacterales bacterium]
VRATRMRLGPPDASRRQRPEETPGSDFDLPADMVIQALGFDPEDAPKLFGAPELAVTRRGTITAEPDPAAPTLDFGAGETNLPGVFAAGDIVRGASLVVWALKDGLNAAEQIHLRLRAKAGQRAGGAAIVAAE